MSRVLEFRRGTGAAAHQVLRSDVVARMMLLLGITPAA